ncbi:TRAP transporter substrate-binding protein [Aquincola sp. S2]|uniref:TRAP transporter substrate-binding protein n=2 Tax=Pseudaquabacterium terrae TaxID=2732868 RepID=A0ABX2EL33_9BURK|nr:TRAP transporter substrate-binding protein [Aquabacterium terrae]
MRCLLGTLAACAAACALAADAPQKLRIVGGLAGVNQFLRHEEPFWTETLQRLTAGQWSAEIVPFDRAGIRGQEMLQLMQVGTVPFGTALLSQSAVNEPLIAAPDLAGLNPDIATLRRSVAAYRPLLAKTLRERHGIELLAVYTYPAQVLFCKKAFGGLADLAGRRIRVASPPQADLVEALGAVPVTIGFAGIVDSVRQGNVDCAITGTMSGNTIGLHELTSHIHPMAVNWGLAIFGANRAVWGALPAELRTLLQRELPKLEQAIWAESERETGEGLACNTGASGCSSGKRGRMVEVRPSADDEQRRRQLFSGPVLGRWLQRCGAGCAEAWNETIGAQSGINAPVPR